MQNEIEVLKAKIDQAELNKNKDLKDMLLIENWKRSIKIIQEKLANTIDIN